MSRCRICTANDEAELVDQMAEAMWLTQETRDPDNEWRPWEHAGPYWQRVMREFAAASLKVLRRDFTVPGLDIDHRTPQEYVGRSG